MKLTLTNQTLEVRFNFGEWLLCFKKKLIIPLNHVTKARFEKPRYGRTNFTSVFFTYQGLPSSNLLKIGNQYGQNGPEFWYVYGDPESKFLTLELSEEKYKKIVLELDPTIDWKKIFEVVDKAAKNFSATDADMSKISKRLHQNLLS